MSHHDWSDETFDWNALNECVRWFPTQLKRYARFNMVGCKEKYGTMRFEYIGMCHTGLYGLIWPGRLRFHLNWPMRIKKSKYGDYPVSILLEINNIITDIAVKCYVSYVFHAYQRLIFNIVTVRAVKKWPHIQKEITDEPDFDDLLYNWVKRYIGYTCNWTTVK